MVQTLHRKAPQSARLAIVPGTYKLKKIENHYFIKGFPETLKKACPDSRSWDTFFTLSSEKAEELRVVTAVLGDMKSLLQKAFTVGKIIKIQSVELKKKKCQKIEFLHFQHPKISSSFTVSEDRSSDILWWLSFNYHQRLTFGGDRGSQHIRALQLRDRLQRFKTRRHLAMSTAF